MEARQKAKEFITKCRFRKVPNNALEMRVCTEEFNDTILAHFLKQYVSEAAEKFFMENEHTDKQTMDIWHWRKWWQQNSSML